MLPKTGKQKYRESFFYFNPSYPRKGGWGGFGPPLTHATQNRNTKIQRVFFYFNPSYPRKGGWGVYCPPLTHATQNRKTRNPLTTIQIRIQSFVCTYTLQYSPIFLKSIIWEHRNFLRFSIVFDAVLNIHLITSTSHIFKKNLFLIWEKKISACEW